MNRRRLLLALAALPLLAALPAQAAVNAAPINAYLQSLRTAQGRFTQTNPNGSTQTGTLLPREARPHPLRVRQARRARW